MQDGWERMSELRRSISLAAKRRQQQPEQADAVADDEGQAAAVAAVPQVQLSTRLHPKDPHLEDLSTAAEFPHRFNTRQEGNPDQVEWLEQDAAGSRTWHAPVAYRLHSLNSRDICYLNITNSTPHDVRMLWLDYQGNEVAYETIAAGDVLRQQTFLTHPWLVREVTTGTRLLLNGREALVPSLQEHREQVAQQAAARQQAAQQQQGVQYQQQQQQQGVLAAGGVGGGLDVHVQQLVMLAGLGAGWPLFEVTVGELPLLQWTKETHALFPDWFKCSTKAFLLCHQKQQRELYGSAAEGRPCLGHLPTELLPLIVGMSLPEVPQGVHFPPAGRRDIKPARLSAPPPAAAPAANAPAAAAAPAGPPEELDEDEDDIPELLDA
uniref:von Hippel-Lindau disease tumour suppressor beta domain-containing protein n=1 Tax=Tetradesmus obliquus TaxID=3088 RepID=A0A383VWW0_TETOB|eukprot:jgi/Sobl393_1/13421/SZX69965.1